jgi:hypothetical chaperone protein
MGMVSEVASTVCPNASLQNSEPFTAVVDGLALATAPGFAAAQGTLCPESAT